MRHKRIELTPAEWTVIKAIWEHEPCTAVAIQALLERETQWSYSTVRTIMDRMTVKGLLHAEKQGKITIFQSAVTREQAQRSELRQALRTAFNGALTPMVQCLLNSSDISARDLTEIEALIKARKKQSTK